MKKLLVIMSSLVVVASLVGPKIVAYKVEQNLKENIKSVNELPGYEVQLAEISSTWFTTKAKINLVLDVASILDTPRTDRLTNLIAELEFKAIHGPVLFTKNSLFGWIDWSITFNDEELTKSFIWDENKPFYQVSAQMGLLGKHSYQDKIPALEINTGRSNKKVTFAGYQGKGTYNNKVINYIGQIGEIKLTKPEGYIIADNSMIELTIESPISEIYSNVFYNSSAKLNIGEFVTKDQRDNEEVQLNNVYLSTSTILKNNNKLVDMAISYGIGAFKFPDLSGDSLAIDIALNNFSDDFLIAYKDSLKQIATGNPDEVGYNLHSFAVQHLLPFLKNSPEFSISNLSVALPKGKISGYLKTNLEQINQLPQDVLDTSFWLEHIEMHGQLTGNQAAVESLISDLFYSYKKDSYHYLNKNDEQKRALAKKQATQLIMQVKESGTIKADGINYVTKFGLKNKIVSINDNKKTIPY